MSVVGIDLGDENLTVAIARRAGIDVLQNEVGKRKTRSGMSFGSVQRFVGDEFINQYFSNAANSVVYIKRLIGKMFNDPEVAHEQTFLPCKLVPDESGRVAIQAKHLGKDVIVTPEQVLATLLSKLKGVVESNMEAGQKMKDCVIGVPHYFTDAQRRGVIDAAKIAKMNPLRLINETTAIALQYGMGRPIEQDRKIVFYDVGISSTDVSLITVSANGLKVEAVASDRNLGGRDIDEALAQHLAKYIKDKYKLDVYSNQKALLKLRKECDAIKQTLSANTKVPFTIEYIMDGVDVSGMVTRDELNSILDTHFRARLMAPLTHVLSATNTDIASLHSLEILGGVTRIPYIQTMIKEFFGRELSKTCDADESVCRGATLQCAILSPSFKVKDYEIKEVAAYGVNVSWAHDATAVPKGEIAAFDTPDNVKLFDAYAPSPAIKIVTIKETQLPLKVSLHYHSNNQPSFPAANPTISRHVITAPAGVTLPSTLKLKIKIKLEASGIVNLHHVEALEEVEVMVPAEPTPAPAPVEGAEGEAVPATEADKMSDAPTMVAKKEVKKTELKFYTYLPSSLSEAAFIKAANAEDEMAYVDRTVHETNAAKNELEGYSLNMRSRVADQNDLGKYFTPAAAAEFISLLKKEEEWLDDDGYDEKKEVYVDRLKKLSAYGQDALNKEWEREHREEAYAHFVKELNRVQQWANTTEDRYSHIAPEDRNKIRAKADALSLQVSQAMQKQNNAAGTDPLAITVANINNYTNELVSLANSIMNKPRPAPPKAEPKKEEKKPEAPKADEAAKTEEASADDKKEEDAVDKKEDEVAAESA